MTTGKRILLAVVILALSPAVLGLTLYGVAYILAYLDMARNPADVSAGVVHSYVCGDLGLDMTGGEVVTAWDDHGGWLGDGEAFLEIRFPERDLSEALAGRPDWQPLPVSRDVRILLYGIEEDGVSRGPVLQSPEREPWVPEIERGYWILVDRQREDERGTPRNPEEPPGINNRYSWNLTVGLYDADRHVLYVLALDT